MESRSLRVVSTKSAIFAAATGSRHRSALQVSLAHRSGQAFSGADSIFPTHRALQHQRRERKAMGAEGATATNGAVMRALEVPPPRRSASPWFASSSPCLGGRVGDGREESCSPRSEHPCSRCGLDGFTGRLVVGDARSPFNSVVLLPFAAVGSSRFAQGHSGLNRLRQRLVRQASLQPVRRQGPWLEPRSVTRKATKTHLHDCTEERMAGLEGVHRVRLQFHLKGRMFQ